MYCYVTLSTYLKSSFSLIILFNLTKLFSLIQAHIFQFYKYIMTVLVIIIQTNYTYKDILLWDQ